MRIKMKDGRVFEGTPRQIVRSMQSVALGQSNRSLREYVAFVQQMTEQFEGHQLTVDGETDDELASSLVSQLLECRLAERL